jgi:hypothetical protein
MAAFDHLSCNCLYEEAKRCIERDKDNKNIIDKQISKYKKEGMPLNYGLIQNRILLRKHNDPTVIKTMEDWWQEIVNYSKRDQISFCYSTWKNNLEYITMEETFPKNNKYFSQRKHKQKGVDRIRQLTKENKEKNIFYKFLYHVGKISKKICNTLKIKMVF